MPSRAVALLAAVFALLAGSAMLRTSTTFDEIVFPAVGARALATGDFGMADDHPRMPQLIYGLPLRLAGVRLPAEGVSQFDYRFARYHYARELYWASGNSPERVAMIARLPGVLFGTLTVIAAFLFARRHMPAPGALGAAALVAFVPDMLAHSGVAYNDVPLAFGFLVSLYTMDAALRRPTVPRAVAAGLALAFTVSVKYSGLILFPAAALLLAMEAWTRRREAPWRREVLVAAGIFAITAYAFLVVLYGGDWRLAEYRHGLEQMSRTAGGRFAYLLGESGTDGWWYFFPLAFVLKTPLGLHVLAVMALAAGIVALRRTHGAGWLSHGARASAVGVALFLAAVMAARLNIGTRHALPMLPPLCILVAQGVTWAWDHGPKAVRAIAAAAGVAMAASSLLAYPYFLSYLSEYTAGRPLYRTLVDSSTDWGQGLVALREYMNRHGIDHVALAYFGSALPEAYGIDYVALPSYFTLPRPVGAGRPARFVAISATLLAGGYVKGDPYAQMRELEPVAVVGGTIYVFDREKGERR